jgi:hypothetical protein
MNYINIAILIILGVSYIRYCQEKLTTERWKSDLSKKASLEKYINQKHLFRIYGEYFYKNIYYFKEHYNYQYLLRKIEQDHPIYGDGIEGFGIISDFFKYNLISTDISGNSITLGETFNIISIGYPNFIKFRENIIHNSNIKFASVEGYYSMFGDDATSNVFCVEINENTRMYIGLSIDRDYFFLNELAKRHSTTIEKGEMYLFVELQKSKYPNEFSSTNPELTYPHFDIIRLRKDIPLERYNEFIEPN